MTLFELIAKLTMDTSEYESKINQSKESASGFGESFKKIGGIAVKAFAAAEAAVGAFAAASVNTGMKFDSSMSQVAATMGTTVDQIQNLRDFAQEMGRTTAFSASEAADAMNILAMAGYNAEENIATLPAVLNMAAAGGLGIAEAADYATGIIAGFSNETLDAATIADKLATVASNAKGDVASFGEGLSTVAGMANTTGQSMQDMTVALGILGNNNYSASEAGNALSRTLKNLYQPTDSAAKAMEALGVNAYDSSGKSRSLQDVLKDLNKGLKGMSEEAKNQALSQIFDAATLKSVPALLNNAGKAWDDLDAIIADSTGNAEKMAGVQLDNLAGDITLFKSALEGAQIAISDGLTPSLREFVQFGSTALSDLTAAFQEGGMTGAMNAFSGILSDGLQMIIKKIPDFASAGMQLLRAIGSGIINSAPVLFEAAGEVVQMLVNGVMDNLPSLVNSASEMLHSLSEGLIEGIPEFMENALPILLGLSESLRENIGTMVDSGIELLLGLAQGIVNALPELIAYVPQIITNIAGIINDNMPKILEAGWNIILMLGQGIINNIPTIIANMGNIVQAIISVVQAINWLDLGSKVITWIGNGLKALAQLPVTIFKEIGHNVINTFKNGFSWSGLGSDIINGIVNGIKKFGHQIADTLTGFAKNAFTKVKNFFGINSPSRLMRDQIGKFIPEGIAVGIDANADSVYDTIKDLSDKTVDAFGSPAYNTSVNSRAGDPLLSEIRSLKDAILGMNVVLDTGAMVGGLAGGMDEQLGSFAVYKGRGN